jgi:hypothetical protein
MSTGRLMMPSGAGVLRVRGLDLDRDPIQVSQMGRIWVPKLIWSRNCHCAGSGCGDPSPCAAFTQ